LMAIQPCSLCHEKSLPVVTKEHLEPMQSAKAHGLSERLVQEPRDTSSHV